MDDHLEQEIAQLHGGVCSALADPTRIRILYSLSEQSCNVTELSEILEIPQSTASRHLKVLRERDLVDSERVGTSVIYALRNPLVIQALDLLRSVVREVNQRRAGLIAE
jgi:DNA-binding transcriptional ArsR family regulator